MRTRKMALAVALLLVGAVAVGSASPLFTEEVTDFGRNRWRNHYTPTEPEFPLSRNARAIWEVPLGLSRSQPLVVQRDFDRDGQPETRIFHIAGDQLWALNGDMIPSRRQGQGRGQYLQQLRAEGFILWNTPVGRLCSPAAQLTVLDELLAQGCSVLGPDAKERPFSSSQAAYWRGNTPDRDVIYVGFGHPASVVAIEAKTGRMLGGHIVEAGSDRGIVGAPLVFPGDTVVIGTTGDLSSGDPDKQGEVFIIKGLTGGTASVRALRVGGRISFSPVPLGESGFIIASDARHTPELGYHGYMMAYSLRTSAAREFTPRWPAAVITPAGIPGEAALDAQTVYFADKFGRLYALRLDTGELLWCRQYPGLGPCAPGGNPAKAFINSGPGVDEDRVYFVFRNREGPNKGSGAVVALNKGTGQPVWEQPMDFEGNTSPVPMGHIVIVGDTGGQVQAYDKRTGEPITYGGYPLRLTDQAYKAGMQGERWWEPIGGTATQMTIAAGLMLVGVNSVSEDQTVLKAFQLYRLPDLTLERLDVPAVADPHGFTATVRAVCYRCAGAVATTVSLSINGRPLVRRSVTFTPDNGWAATLQWPSGILPAGASVEVVAMVDPDNMVDEADETNNSLRATVVIATSASGRQTEDGWGSILSN